jgi:ADP-heptose:LPS heptosyltransferase
MRFISLYFRNRKGKKTSANTINTFIEWSSQIDSFPKYPCKRKSVALVRLDDIGDYVLFRNFIRYYRESTKYQNYSITLIGNKVWKELFIEYDKSSVDEFIWIDKSAYFSDPDYRYQIWREIRNHAFEFTICASRTRPVLLDDIITLAADARINYGNKNTHSIPLMNQMSDKIYTSLFADDYFDHEFEFNKKFTKWITCIDVQLKLPNISCDLISDNSIVCFIGASVRSKRWPNNHWAKLIEMLKKNRYNPILLGGKQDEKNARIISRYTDCKSLTGKTSLVETIKVLSSASIIVSGDTMASHLAVSLNKRLVILCNGVNAGRFSNYNKLNYQHCRILYSKHYEKFLNEKNDISRYNGAITRDMHSIKPQNVFKIVKQMLTENLLDSQNNT